jgi:hypothetical protein
MQKVRAKFKCSAVIPNPWGDGTTAHFHAVYGTEGENADFTKATPCGNLSMIISSDVPASTFFQQGSEYYLDFINAETK